MMRVLLLILLNFVAAAELSAPRIGVVRDLDGVARTLLGVPGAFLLGDPTDCEPGDDSASPLSIEDNELVIQPAGIRLPLPEPIHKIERAAPEWFVLRAEARLYVVHTRPKHEKIYQLPGAAR